MKVPLTAEEEKFIQTASNFFEKPSLLVKSIDLLAAPIDKLNKYLPAKVQQQLSKVVRVSLEKALLTSVKSISTKSSLTGLGGSSSLAVKSGRLHQAATVLTGGIGGVFGVGGALVELPLSTMIMLRSIASIAENFGEDIHSPETLLECLTVFSIGGHQPQDDFADTIYYGTRMSLALAVKEATVFLAANQAKQILHAVESGGAPTLVRLITQIAAQFEIRVTRKFLLQAAPIIGAAGGAAINGVFSSFYNDTARYHFGLRQLERKYGREVIEAVYKKQVKN